MSLCYLLICYMNKASMYNFKRTSSKQKSKVFWIFRSSLFNGKFKDSAIQLSEYILTFPHAVMETLA